MEVSIWLSDRARAINPVTRNVGVAKLDREIFCEEDRKCLAWNSVEKDYELLESIVESQLWAYEIRNAAIGDGALELTIDLSNAQMIDSTGIGLLISAHNSMRKIGGRLAVVHASGEIIELFRAMRIHQHFGVSGK